MTYVLSDLHGNYQKFLSILRQISFCDDDVMYLLGDLVDYGDEPVELIEDLSLRLNVYPIAGEHDFLAVRMLSGFDRMLKRGTAPDEDYISEMTGWVADGGQATLDAFRTLDADRREGMIEYLEDMALYEETTVGGKRYVMVHAGIAGYDPETDPENYQPEDFFSDPLDPAVRLIDDATLIVGHAPTGSGKIEYGEGSVFMDCGAAQDGRLGCLCLETGKEFYA